MRSRKHGVQWMYSLSSHEFRRAFRMSKDNFYILLHLVEDDLRKDKFKAMNSSGSPVTPLIKLAATVRWLAGGMYIDICGLYGLSQTSFFIPFVGRCGPQSTRWILLLPIWSYFQLIFVHVKKRRPILLFFRVILCCSIVCALLTVRNFTKHNICL